MAGIIFSSCGKKPLTCVTSMLTGNPGAGEGAVRPGGEGAVCRMHGQEEDQTSELKGVVFPGRAGCSRGQGQMPEVLLQSRARSAGLRGDEKEARKQQGAGGQGDSGRGQDN